VKRAMIILLNAVLALLILATIVATWMPAIYRSPWFKHTFPKL
jgi:hypothetical protein